MIKSLRQYLYISWHRFISTAFLSYCQNLNIWQYVFEPYSFFLAQEENSLSHFGTVLHDTTYHSFWHIRKFKRAILAGMQMSGTLEAHLIETNRRAEEMYSQLVRQYAANEGVTEELKRRNQMAWTGAMNNIRERVMEVVANELIFT